MAEPDPSSILIEDIQNNTFEDTQVFNELSQLAINSGLSPTNISKLLVTVIGSTLTLPHKTKLLKECMIPKHSSYLSPNLYLKVLGCVGAPELYYKNGKQHKSKRLPLPLQQKLLMWLICVLPYFGDQAYSCTRRSLPLLFGLLSYEFSRPYIATLLVVGTSRQSTLQTKQKVLRPWHIQMVTDLHLRFSQDDSLILLLHHFSRIDPQLDLRHYFKSNPLPHLTASSNTIGFSDIPALQEARKIRRGSSNQFSTAISDVDSELSRLFKSFTPFSKRRKLDPTSDTAQDLLAPSIEVNAVPISTISSVPALAKHFENIKFLNPSSVLSATASKNIRIRCLYTSLRLLDTGLLDPFYKKFLFALKYHILNDEASSSMFTFKGLIKFAQFGGLLEYGNLISQFMDTQTNSQVTLKQKIELLRFANLANLNLKPILEGIAAHITNLYDSDPKAANSITSSFLYNASIGIKKFSLLESNGLGVLSLLKTFTSVIFDLISEGWSRLHLSVKIAFMKYLRVIRSAVESDQIEENGEFFIPPIPFFYRLICSTNPLIVSEALGYTSFLKTLKFAPESSAQTVRKAFIMDCANFVWRDKAFQIEEGTVGSGMFLDAHYLGKLSSLNHFSNSDLVSLKSVGNIIQNPCFSYICAEQVWKLEDSSPEINCRHPGPLSESTIERFQRDVDVVWLPMTYADIRLKILQNLDEMGFKGLGDFLFTSIRSLTNQRQLSSQEED